MLLKSINQSFVNIVILLPLNWSLLSSFSNSIFNFIFKKHCGIITYLKMKIQNLKDKKISNYDCSLVDCLIKSLGCPHESFIFFIKKHLKKKRWGVVSHMYLPNSSTHSWFMSFSRVLVQSETQTASSRTWTWFAVSISYDDNHCTTWSSVSVKSIYQKIFPSIFVLIKYILYVSSINVSTKYLYIYCSFLFLSSTSYLYLFTN